MSKVAITDYPVHALIANRWSPYAFADRDVAAEDLRAAEERLVLARISLEMLGL